MANYFYKWTPLFIVGTIVLLGLPWLGLIALILVALVVIGALGAVAFAIAWVIETASRAIGHGLRELGGAAHRIAPALSPARSTPQQSQLPPTGA
jgi:hypothetical protein